MIPLPLAQLHWVKTGGPIGGLGYDVRMRPGNPDFMLVTDAWSGVNMSTNGGQTWSAANTGITTRTGPSGDAIPVFSLTIDPSNPDIVWAGTQGVRGIFKSTDGGRTWTKKDNGVVEDAGITFRGFSVDPRNSNTVYAAAEVSSWIWAGELRNGQGFDLVKGVIYRTTDGGVNWSAIWRGNDLARYVWISPADSNVIYISTGLFDREAANSDPAADSPGGEGVVKSTDGGRTWRVLGRQNGLNNLYVGSLFMHPENPDILLAGTGNNTYMEGSGVYLSTDGGETWRQTLVINNTFGPTTVNSVEFATSDPRIAYAASPFAFYRSEDTGRTWQLMSGGRPTWQWGAPGIKAGFPIDFQVDPRNPNRIFANNYGGGNFVSEDGGRTWTVASRGYTGAQLHTVTVDPRDPNRVLTIGRSGPFRSFDAGNTWEGLSYDSANMSVEWYDIAHDPAHPDIVLMSGEHQGNLLRSTDGGRHWQLVFRHPQANPASGNLQGFKDIAFAPSNPNIVYAGMSTERNAIDQKRAGSSYGVYKSRDGGITWSESNDGNSAGQNINALAVHPQNPDVLYAATLKTGVLKSTDGGKTWHQTNQGLPVRDIRSIVIDARTPEIVYAGTQDSAIFKSNNGGVSWVSIGRGMDPQAAIRTIVIDPTNSSTVYAADVQSGVYRSTDAGQNWARMNDRLRTRAVTSLGISADGTTLYAATTGEGVFRIDLTGRG